MRVLLLALTVSLTSLIISGLFINVLIFFLGTLLCLILAFFKKTIWYYLFLGLLISAATPLVSIASFEFKMGFNSVSFNFLTVFFTIIHIALNRHQMIYKKSSTGKSSTLKGFGQSKEAEQSDFNNLVNRFTLKFKNKSPQELQTIIDNPKMVAAAKAAAKILLSK